jgi:hypothetical protein
MLFLRFSEAQTCKWAVFATSWNYHLHVAHAWCLQRVGSKICKMHGLCHPLKPNTCNLAETCKSLKVTWINWKAHAAFCGARPSFRPSPPLFPFPCRDYFLLSCWFSILRPFSFDKLAWGRGSVACSRDINSSAEVSSPLPLLLHVMRECSRLLR